MTSIEEISQGVLCGGIERIESSGAIGVRERLIESAHRRQKQGGAGQYSRVAGRKLEAPLVFRLGGSEIKEQTRLYLGQRGMRCTEMRCQRGGLLGRGECVVGGCAGLAPGMRDQSLVLEQRTGLADVFVGELWIQSEGFGILPDSIRRRSGKICRGDGLPAIEDQSFGAQVGVESLRIVGPSAIERRFGRVEQCRL